MFVHFKVESETVRVFIDGDENSYKERKPYDAVATIKYCSDGSADISAALGLFPIAASRKIIEHCESMGVTEIRWEHKNKNRNKEI